MRKKMFVCLVIGLSLLIACNQATTQNAGQKEDKKELTSGKSTEVAETTDENLPEMTEENPKVEKTETANSQTNEPKTVLDFFRLLPQKYFVLEGCYPDKDKDCRKAREEYLKNYKEIEDTKNGYFKGGCDGGQSCIEMALFKRPDKTYVIALGIFGEMLEENYFLDYKNGVWTDISAKIVPEFSKQKVYEIPRYGTTVKVFSTKLIEKGDDYEIREKAEKLYDLEWKDGKFVKK